MGDKKWYGGGLCSRIRKTGPRAGREDFSGRVWIPSIQAFRWIKVGGTLREARRNLARKAADPEQVLEHKKQHRERPLMFEGFVERFLKDHCDARKRAYYEPRQRLGWDSSQAGGLQTLTSEPLSVSASGGSAKITARARRARASGQSERVRCCRI